MRRRLQITYLTFLAAVLLGLDIPLAVSLAASSSQTINQVTAAYRDTGNTQDFGGRMIQLAAPISW